MSQILEYTNISDARDNFKSIYDSASANVSAVVRRKDDEPVVVINQKNFLEALRALCPLHPQVRFSEDGSVSMWLPGIPVSSQGSDFEVAGNGLIQALRDYSLTWVEDLRRYPNHEDNWGLVNLVLLSSDHALFDHLFGDK
jgi:hypothetical protein